MLVPGRALQQPQPDDASLVERFRAGDQAAFALLYGRHARYVAGVVFRMMGADPEVDDLVQEVFADAAEGLSTLDDPAQVRGWLVAVAVRRAYRRLAQQRRRRWLTLEFIRQSPPAGDTRALDPLVALYEALDRLSPKLRIPWFLSEVERETVPQVARLCGISVATAKRRIATARTRLERRLRAG